MVTDPKEVPPVNTTAIRPPPLPPVEAWLNVPASAEIVPEPPKVAEVI